jgi:hypothetical protein
LIILSPEECRFISDPLAAAAAAFQLQPFPTLPILQLSIGTLPRYSDLLANFALRYTNFFARISWGEIAIEMKQVFARRGKPRKTISWIKSPGEAVGIGKFS